jgi:ribosomal protein S27E
VIFEVTSVKQGRVKMVMPVGNIKVTCLDCGWHKVIYQSSDVVMLPKQCKKCGGLRLETANGKYAKIFATKVIKTVGG